MTVKFVVLYTQPEDAEAFDEHYLGEHLRLTHAVPGVQRVETGRVLGAADGGEQSWFRVAELWFEDEDAMQRAVATDEGKAMGADFQAMMPPGSRVFVVDVD